MNTWKKGIATWRVDDTLYISVPFTWLMEEAREIAAGWKGKALIGGPGTGAPSECPGFEPVIYHNPSATFTTRGCPGKHGAPCEFCMVNRLEPNFLEIPNFRPAPVLCDNNPLVATKKHIQLIIDREKQYRLVDFNQGVDAGIFIRRPDIADMLGKLRCRIRFALDSWDDVGVVEEAINLCRARTTNLIGVYCLINWKESPADAIARLDLVRTWGVRPNPMRFQPLNATVKNSYVAPGWTETELRRIMHYYSKLRYYEHIPFQDFARTAADKSPQIAFEL